MCNTYGWQVPGDGYIPWMTSNSQDIGSIVAVCINMSFNDLGLVYTPTYIYIYIYTYVRALYIICNGMLVFWCEVDHLQPDPVMLFRR